MSLRFTPAVVMFFAMLAIIGFAGAAGAASVYGVLPFQNTGDNPQSHYGDGSHPASELLQASDGNYYGTTEYGGASLCPMNVAPHSIIGCGTIFRVNSNTGAETVLYTFPYDIATRTAPDGAYPTAGLIQGQDGALYGVAEDGGIPGCNGASGCGTLFRITTAGAFTLLHQFCGKSSCPGVDEGANPAYHLVQSADGTLYGATADGGFYSGGDTGLGTLFAATTSGAVNTLYDFASSNHSGYGPAGPLLIGTDGSTLYGVTQYGGSGGLGTVFSFGTAGYTILHSFDEVGFYRPAGALIYGADGLLYGAADIRAGVTVYSLSVTGSDFALGATLSNQDTETGVLLGSDGMMYGTLYGGTVGHVDGGLFVYDPTTKVINALFAFVTATGYAPRGALIEGKDRYLYGSNEGGGPSNSFGAAEGTLFRIGPPLAK